MAHHMISFEGKTESAHRNRVARWAVVLFCAGMIVYLTTFSPIGAGDGPSWLRDAMIGDLVRMFPLQHVLHTFLLHLYLRMVTIGSSIPLAEQDYFEMVRKAQIPFAMVAAAGISVFYWIVYRITRQLSTAIIAGLLLMFAHGYWLNANLETKNYTLLLWMVTFAMSMEYRPGNTLHLTTIGLMGALTTLAEIDAGIAAIVVTYFIVVKNRNRIGDAIKEVVFVGLIWASFVVLVVWLISLFMPSWQEWLFDISTGDEFVNFLTMRPNFRQFVREPLTGLMLSLAIGQSDAFVTGFMLPKRIFQDRIFITRDWISLVLYGTAVCMTLVYALRGLYSQYRLKQRAQRHIAVDGMIVWFVSYHALTWWNQPIASDYRVLSLAPLVFFVALGINFQKESGALTGSLPRGLTPALFFLLLVANNWTLSIYPNAMYGQNRRDAYHLLRPMADEHDIFISSQWSIPWIPEIQSENIWDLATLTSAHSDSSAEQGIDQMRRLIGDAPNGGRQVFVVGLVPGSYELRALNRFRSDGNLYQAEEFAALQDELMVEHKWQPLFMVLDARNQATYQLGRQWTPLWVVCAEPASACLQGVKAIAIEDSSATALSATSLAE